MSFFGFDTTLPGAQRFPPRKPQSSFDPTPVAENEETLDAKIKALAAGAQEDVEIYTWGQEGYDGLGDKLDESGDDLNEDTFGDFDAEVGKDFDFGHPAQPPQQQQKGSANKFAASLDDFLVDPPRFGAGRGQGGQQRQGKTLEEVEAEMMAMRGQQQQPPAPAPAAPERKAMTVEEVEAELRARRSAPPSQPPPPQQPMGPPPSLAAIMASQASQPRPSPQIPNLPPMPPPSADPATLQAAHFARMSSLLAALPPLVQSSILSLPPPMQFDSLESVVHHFPTLLDPSTRSSSSAAEQEAVRFMMEKASSQMADFNRMEEKRKRRMDKIASMSRYNGMMSGGDKDFITRIQISQLISADPYQDDFYAHIYWALRGGQPRPGLPIPEPQPKEGKRKGGKGSKQQNAMLRMQQQVERIVKSRQERAEKGAAGAALEGALGRVSLSSTKNPRQMLSLGTDKATKAAPEGDVSAGHARDAVRQALEGASLGGESGLRRDPLTKYEVLRILEKLYDLVLQLEQLRRAAPPSPSSPIDPTDEASAALKEAHSAHTSSVSAVTQTLWSELRVLEPLEISDPHPFVSLLSCAKGKRLLPRALRHLTAEQTLTALTMVVASFESLDVVKDGPLLDDLSDEPSRIEKRRDAERQSETFAQTIVPAMMAMASTAPMRIVSGMLALFVERNDPVRVSQTRPGVAFLTIFLSRAEQLRQGGEVPAEELEQFKQIFALLFSRLTAQGKLVTLFPSTRSKASLPFGVGYYMGGLGQSLAAQTAGGRYRNVDLEDEPSWNLMAALAVSASMDQQQVLVAELREKILENVISAKEQKRMMGGNGGGMGEEMDIRIRNVNLLLHALNLDAAQISV